jgi:hypothetical protein
VVKTPIEVHVKRESYSISGKLFRNKKQNILDVLNDGMFFLPMTDVTISMDSGYFGNRPFVAVNKQQIISVVEMEQD